MHDIEYLKKLKKSPKLQELEWYQCKADPYYWLTHWATTINEHYEDWIEPIQTFPDKEYMRVLVDLWMKHKILIITKTRQMMLSWLCVALYLWDTQFHKARFTAFQSKQEDDADELVKRLKGIWDREPSFLKRYYEKGKVIELQANPQNRGWHTYWKFELPQIHSRIHGYAQWWDRLRMFTFSWVFSDEAAFQPEMDAAFTALRPTLSNNGRFTAVSTPDENTWFEDAVFDNFVM